GLALGLPLAYAQESPHAGHEHQHHGGAAPKGTKAKTPAKKEKKSPPHKHKHSSRAKRAPAAHSGHPGPAHEHGGMVMKGLLGPYPMTREASGTSWQPDATPHDGVHAAYGDWMVMWHGLINGVYDHQGGPRGDQKTFASGMVMGMAQRQLGDGTLGFRAML